LGAHAGREAEQGTTKHTLYVCITQVTTGACLRASASACRTSLVSFGHSSPSVCIAKRWTIIRVERVRAGLRMWAEEGGDTSRGAVEGVDAPRAAVNGLAGELRSCPTGRIRRESRGLVSARGRRRRSDPRRACPLRLADAPRRAATCCAVRLHVHVKRRAITDVGWVSCAARCAQRRHRTPFLTRSQ
jgi:hypothetical protein